jgi:imidazolonepropionase-like amidohydrolase
MPAPFSEMNARCLAPAVVALVALACGGLEGRSSMRTARETPAPIVAPSPPSSLPPTLALVGGLLIDGRGGEPVPDAAIVLRDGLIAAVGPRATVPIPEDAEVVEVSGGSILPGLINAHVHNAIQTATLQHWAAAGVTTVRDVGAREPAAEVFAFRDAARADPRLARLVAVGPLVTVPGAYPLVPNGFPAWAVQGPDDARARINTLVDLGAELIKITLEPGGQRLPVLSLSEVQAIVQTAHLRDRIVTAHVTAADYVELALRAGVDEICHIPAAPLSDDLIARMVAADLSVVPTLEAIRGGDANVRRLVAAGGRVALGNDGGYLAGLEVGMPIAELEHMQRAGMTPMQVLVAATAEAARACRLGDVLGTLEPGKAADLLIVDGDPLGDLRALTRARVVIHGGYPIVRR